MSILTEGELQLTLPAGVRGRRLTELLNRTEALRHQLPLCGPGGRPWPVPHVAGCAVMNMGAWNRYMQNMPVTRLVTTGC